MRPTMPEKEDKRQKEIRLIQIAKRQLNMDDDVYRGLLAPLPLSFSGGSAHL